MKYVCKRKTCKTMSIVLFAAKDSRSAIATGKRSVQPRLQVRRSEAWGFPKASKSVCGGDPSIMRRRAIGTASMLHHVRESLLSSTGWSGDAAASRRQHRKFQVAEHMNCIRTEKLDYLNVERRSQWPTEYLFDKAQQSLTGCSSCCRLAADSLNLAWSERTGSLFRLSKLRGKSSRARQSQLSIKRAIQSTT